MSPGTDARSVFYEVVSQENLVPGVAHFSSLPPPSNTLCFTCICCPGMLWQSRPHHESRSRQASEFLRAPVVHYPSILILLGWKLKAAGSISDSQNSKDLPAGSLPTSMKLNSESRQWETMRVGTPVKDHYLSNGIGGLVLEALYLAGGQLNPLRCHLGRGTGRNASSSCPPWSKTSPPGETCDLIATCKASMVSRRDSVTQLDGQGYKGGRQGFEGRGGNATAAPGGGCSPVATESRI